MLALAGAGPLAFFAPPEHVDRAADAERPERAQVRLHARAAAAVGTGDGQRDGLWPCRFHGFC